MKLTRMLLIVATLAMAAAQTTRTTRATTIGTMEKMKTTTLIHYFPMKNYLIISSKSFRTKT